MDATVFMLGALINSLLELRSEISPQIVYADEISLDATDLWLNDLEGCESGHTDVTILDTNGKYSYAWLQFQQETFDGYGKTYKLPHDDIHSRTQQHAIAKKMIENGLWYHWKNCALKIGLPVKIE